MIVNFVKRIYEATYEIKDNYYSYGDGYWPTTEKVGLVISRTNSKILLRDVILCTRELDQPPLELRSNIFDKELDKMFTVLDFIRNTDNTYTCIVEEDIEDTSDSLCRREKLESEIIAQKDKVGKLHSRIEELKIDLKYEKSKPIWKIIKDRIDEYVNG